MHFHLNSRETCFPYKFFNSRPHWQCCCLLLGFQHFFWFFMEPFSFRPYCRKPVQDRAKKKISVLVVSMERNKPRRQVSHVSEGRTGIPGIPALMEKRCHCLAAEMHATGSLLNQSIEHAHAPSRKSSSRCILKHPPCLQQQVHWADTHPLGTTS